MITINTKQYDQDTNNGSSATYTGPAHSLTDKDVVGLGRVLPKRNGTNLGVAKGSVYFNRSVVVNALTGQKEIAALRIETSFPVGMPEADQTAMIADAEAFLGSEAAADLFGSLKINQ